MDTRVRRGGGGGRIGGRAGTGQGKMLPTLAGKGWFAFNRKLGMEARKRALCNSRRAAAAGSPAPSRPGPTGCLRFLLRTVHRVWRMAHGLLGAPLRHTLPGTAASHAPHQPPPATCGTSPLPPSCPRPLWLCSLAIPTCGTMPVRFFFIMSTIMLGSVAMVSCSRGGVRVWKSGQGPSAPRQGPPLD